MKRSRVAANRPNALASAAVLAGAFALPVSIALAQEAASPVETEEPPARGALFAEKPDARPANARAVLMLDAELGILDRTPLDVARPPAPGVGIQAVAAPGSFPVLVGLGAGLMWFTTSSRHGPSEFHFDGVSGTWGSTELSHSITLRHAELLARIQPIWWRVRPFAEGFVGVAALWSRSTLTAPNDRTLEHAEEQHSVGMAFGGRAGLDVEILPPRTGPDGTWALLMTIGLRRWLTTPMRRVDLSPGPSTEVLVSENREPLRMWSPFVGITLGADSRPSARQAPP